VQGYYFSRPLAADRFAELLRQQQRPTEPQDEAVSMLPATDAAR
jgi:hypothetical protein